MSGNLDNAIGEGARLYLDANILIYHLQDDARYRAVLRPVFVRVAAGSVGAISSFLTLFEVLVKPYKEGREDIAIQYRERLTTTPNLRLLPLDKVVAGAAAKLRAEFSLKTPDAIQAGTALSASADVFLTNDEGFRRVSALRILVLEDYL
jgi:predicted nucleic acid-binding protein